MRAIFHESTRLIATAFFWRDRILGGNATSAHSTTIPTHNHPTIILLHSPSAKILPCVFWPHILYHILYCILNKISKKRKRKEKKRERLVFSTVFFCKQRLETPVSFLNEQRRVTHLSWHKGERSLDDDTTGVTSVTRSLISTATKLAPVQCGKTLSENPTR